MRVIFWVLWVLYLDEYFYVFVLYIDSGVMMVVLVVNLVEGLCWVCVW